MSTYLHLSETALKKGTTLIIWPETAIQYWIQKAVPVPLLDLLDRYEASAVIGGFRQAAQSGRPVLHNSAFFLDKSGIRGIYDKMHLVPVSEYSPFQLSHALKMRFAYNQLTPGEKPVNFLAPQGCFSTLICFEIIFPELARAAVNNGAEYLINISNDAWFGRTNGHLQHFSMGIFRAVECRRPLIRSANTGISGFVTSSGQTVTQLGPFQEGSVHHRPQAGKRDSFYLRQIGRAHV